MQALVVNSTNEIEGHGINLTTDDPNKRIEELTPEQAAIVVQPMGKKVLNPDGTITVTEVPLPPPPVIYGEELPFKGMVRTTDATPTEVYRMTLNPLTGYAGIATVIGVDANNGAVKVLRASFAVKRLNAGSLSVGTPVVLASHADTGTAAWAITPSVPGTDVVLSVTGAAGRTIDWGVTGTMQSFAPAGV